MPHNDKSNLSQHRLEEKTSETEPFAFHTPSSSASSSPSLSSHRGADLSDLEKDDFEYLINGDLLSDSTELLPDDGLWKTYTDNTIDGPIHLREDLLEKGLVVFSDQRHPDITASKFPLGDRHLSFVTLSERMKKAKIRPLTSSSARVASQLHFFTQGSSIKAQENKIDTAKLKQVLPLNVEAKPDSIQTHTFDELTDLVMSYYAEYDLIHNPNLNVIITENRSDEIFFPFNFTDESKSSQTGLYIYPWPSCTSNGSAEKEEFINQYNGFLDFFSGACLFGSTLQGICNKQQKVQLIKADAELHSGQIIEQIHYETALQLHGITQLQELEKQICLAKQLAKEKNVQDIRFHFHLPGYDYLFIGAELALKGNITLKAFELFCFVVLKHQAIYAMLIEKISIKHNFPITIVNPFQFLFKDLPHIDLLSKSNDNVTKTALAKAILALLNITYADENTSTTPLHLPQKRNDDLIYAELDSVAECLKLLQAQNADNTNTLATAWSDFIKTSKTPIRKFKDLMHLGNTVMVGAIAYKKAPHSVCAFHPVSEKHIFVSYGKHLKKNPNYPLITCLTTMSTVQPHSKLYQNNRGLTFYNTSRVGALVSQSTELGRQAKLTETAGENVAHNALSNNPPRHIR